MSLPSRNRIKKLLPNYFSDSAKLFSNLFVVYKKKFANQKTGKFVISVNKKVSRKSTKRNEIKRKVTSAIFKNLKDIPPFNYFISIKPRALTSSFSEIESNIKDALTETKK